MLSLKQSRFITIIPMVSGSLSLIASTTLITMILMSSTKLSVPVRRIFFGLCVYDCIYSLANALSTVPVPRESGIWGAFGNEYSCNFQGTLLQIGLTGTLYYNAALSTYYVCVIRYSMSEKVFHEKIERYIHYFINFLAVSSGFFLLLTKQYTNINSACWISNEPKSRRLIFGFSSVLTSFMITLVNMILIVCSVVTLHQKAKKWRLRTASSSTQSSRKSKRLSSLSHGSVKSIRKQAWSDLEKDPSPLTFDLRAARLKHAKHNQSVDDEGQVHIPPSSKSSDNISQSVTLPLNDNGRRGSLNFNTPKTALRKSSVSIDSAGKSEDILPRGLKRVSHRWKEQIEVIKQAFLYIGSFLLCFLFSSIYRLSQEGDDMYMILVLSRIFTPLQGLFNICIYCRPHVISLRRRRPEVSWWHACWLTVKTGGDHNLLGQSKRRRKSNLIGNDIFLKRLKRDHLQRMATARKSIVVSGSDAKKYAPLKKGIYEDYNCEDLLSKSTGDDQAAQQASGSKLIIEEGH